MDPIGHPNHPINFILKIKYEYVHQIVLILRLGGLLGAPNNVCPHLVNLF